MNIKELKARLVELNEKGKAIQAKADAEKRELNADEQKELEALFNEFESVEADIKRREILDQQSARLSEPGARQVAASTNTPPVTNAAPAHAPRAGMQNSLLPTLEERARWGFRDFGEFCSSVRAAATNPSGMDQRLIQNALSTYGSEAVGADGGFAVPPEWRSQINQLVAGEDSLLSRTDQQTAAGNSITFPVDESTAWQSTGGILAYWDSEAATMTQSKPALREVQIKLHRLTALVPVTDELLEDSAALGSYVSRKAGEKLAFQVNNAIINGTGVGQPLGILNAPCTVSVAKIASQVAATVHAKNVVAMMARMPAASFGRAVWLVNQDVMPQILQLGFPVTDGTTTVAGAGALYMSPGQFANQSTYGSILGRPIVVTEACSTLGTVGDIVLADLSQYLTVVKSGGVKSDTSIHLYFDQNTTAFRFVQRMSGQPWLSAAITRKNGSNTLSHFVTLATRS